FLGPGTGFGPRSAPAPGLRSRTDPVGEGLLGTGTSAAGSPPVGSVLGRNPADGSGRCPLTAGASPDRRHWRIAVGYRADLARPAWPSGPVPGRPGRIPARCRQYRSGTC